MPIVTTFTAGALSFAADAGGATGAGSADCVGTGGVAAPPASGGTDTGAAASVGRGGAGSAPCLVQPTATRRSKRDNANRRALVIAPHSTQQINALSATPACGAARRVQNANDVR